VYVPPHFNEPNPGRLHGLMRRFDFALLVLGGEGDGGAPEAAHLPFLLDADRGPHGTLIAHMARANPLWRRFDPVHAHGTPRIIEDPAAARAILERLVDTQEAGRPQPWRMADARAGLIDTMARAIVAFELPITRLEGKFKLSQNRSAADRAGVTAALDDAGDDASRALATLMAEADAPTD
jgi:transcriptional regulator